MDNNVKQKSLLERCKEYVRKHRIITAAILVVAFLAFGSGVILGFFSEDLQNLIDPDFKSSTSQVQPSVPTDRPFNSMIQKQLTGIGLVSFLQRNWRVPVGIIGVAAALVIIIQIVIIVNKRDALPEIPPEEIKKETPAVIQDSEQSVWSYVAVGASLFILVLIICGGIWKVWKEKKSARITKPPVNQQVEPGEGLDPKVPLVIKPLEAALFTAKPLEPEKGLELHDAPPLIEPFETAALKIANIEVEKKPPEKSAEEADISVLRDQRIRKLLEDLGELDYGHVESGPMSNILDLNRWRSYFNSNGALIKTVDKDKVRHDLRTLEIDPQVIPLAWLRLLGVRGWDEKNEDFIDNLKKKSESYDSLANTNYGDANELMLKVEGSREDFQVVKTSLDFFQKDRHRSDVKGAQQQCVLERILVAFILSGRREYVQSMNFFIGQLIKAFSKKDVIIEDAEPLIYVLFSKLFEDYLENSFYDGFPGVDMAGWCKRIIEEECAKRAKGLSTVDSIAERLKTLGTVIVSGPQQSTIPNPESFKTLGTLLRNEMPLQSQLTKLFLNWVYNDAYEKGGGIETPIALWTFFLSFEKPKGAVSCFIAAMVLSRVDYILAGKTKGSAIHSAIISPAKAEDPGWLWPELRNDCRMLYRDYQNKNIFN